MGGMMPQSTLNPGMQMQPAPIADQGQLLPSLGTQPPAANDTGPVQRQVLSTAQPGVMRHIQDTGKFGFIKPDSGGADVLALPPRDGGFPPVGTRVHFDLVMCDRTGRPK